MPRNASTRSTPNRPEKKFGPYPGGIGVAVWLNTIETQHGSKKVRSVTISPRRYRDSKTGEWRDATSFRVGDLPALIFGLQKALEHSITSPLPGENDGQEALYNA